MQPDTHHNIIQFFAVPTVVHLGLNNCIKKAKKKLKRVSTIKAMNPAPVNPNPIKSCNKVIIKNIDQTL